MPLADCILILEIKRSATDGTASARPRSHCRRWPQCQDNAFVQTSSPVATGTWATELCLPLRPPLSSPARSHHAGGCWRRQGRGGHGSVLAGTRGAGGLQCRAGGRAVPAPRASARSARPRSPEALEQAGSETGSVSRMESEDTIYKSFPKGYDNGLLINRRVGKTWEALEVINPVNEVTLRVPSGASPVLRPSCSSGRVSHLGQILILASTRAGRSAATPVLRHRALAPGSRGKAESRGFPLSSQVRVTAMRCSEEPLLSAPLLSVPVRFNSPPTLCFHSSFLVPLKSLKAALIYSTMLCINSTCSTSMETC